MYKIPVANHLGLTLAEVLPDLYPQLEPHLRRALVGEAVTGVKFCRPKARPAGSVLYVSRLLHILGDRPSFLLIAASFVIRPHLPFSPGCGRHCPHWCFSASF
jgi:hypothetical protein